MVSWIEAVGYAQSFNPSSFVRIRRQTGCICKDRSSPTRLPVNQPVFVARRGHPPDFESGPRARSGKALLMADVLDVRLKKCVVFADLGFVQPKVY